MPAYRVKIDVKKVKELMSTAGSYRVYSFGREMWLNGATFSQILRDGKAGPKGLFMLQQAYEKVHNATMPEDYFLKTKAVHE